MTLSLVARPRGLSCSGALPRPRTGLGFAFAGRFAVGPRVPLRAPAPSVAHPDDDHFSWNTSDFTMTGTTPLGATGAPTSM